MSDPTEPLSKCIQAARKLSNCDGRYNITDVLGMLNSAIEDLSTVDFATAMLAVAYGRRVVCVESKTHYRGGTFLECMHEDEHTWGTPGPFTQQEIGGTWRICE